MANKILIKRSLANATVTGLSNGELAFTANGDILHIGSPNGSIIAIAGLRTPGVLTANQALVANSTSGIDKVIVANLVPTAVWANGAAGTGGQILTSNSTGGVYWSSPSAGVAGSDTQVQFNDGGALAGDTGFTFNKTTDTLTVGNTEVIGKANATQFTVGTTFTANSTLVNAAALNVVNQVNTATLYATTSANIGTAFTVNSTTVNIASTVGLRANGTIGTSGQILYSNGTTAYWSAAPTGTITGVTAGNGLTGGGSSGSVTLNVGAGNGITVAADTVSVDGANGISVDSSGVNVLAGTNGGLSVNATGVWVVAGSGLLTNATGVHVGTGNGVAVDADSIRVVGGNGLVSNATGVHILTSGDSTLIANATGLYVNDASLSIASSQITGDIALGTQTSGNYVATITAGNGISGSASAEGATPTIAVVANNGLVSNSSGVFVLGNTGVTVNSTGVHIGQNVATTSNVTFANVVTTGLSVTGSVSSNLMPAANNTYHLGNTTIKWAQVHAANVHGSTGIFDGNVEIAGDLIVTGNVVATNVGSLVVGDAKILLAANNPGDVLDIGFSGTYTDGGATVRHAGLFRDASDNGVFKIFSNTTQSDLAGNNVVNTTATGYVTGVLQAFLKSGGLFTNSSTVTVTANSTVSVAIVANTLSLSTALPTTSGGTGLNSYTSGDILVGNTSNVLSKLSLGTDGKVLQSNGSALVYDDLDGGTF